MRNNAITRPTQLESLERRQLLANILPAFADRIGLVGLINPDTTFEDNFDGTSLDKSKWQVREGPRWRKVPNGAIDEMSLNGEESIVVRGGNLELIAHTDANGRNRAGYIQTSATFKNNQPDYVPRAGLKDGYSGSFEQTFGYWEARVKFSSLPGQWSAFWVHSYGMVEVGNDPAKINRPDLYGTEYDIAEHAAVRQGSNASHEISTVVHANGYENYQRSSAIHRATRNYGPSYANPDAFHVYGLHWTPTVVKFFIDGNLVHTETDPVMISKAPHVAILSNEIGAGGALYENAGSNFFGNVPDEGYGSLETSRAKLTADYVRVWQLKEFAPPTPTLGSIGGIVFNDANRSGTRDSGEPGLANRVIYVDTNWNGVLESGERRATTNAAGEYVLGDLQPGTHLVRQILSSGTQTAPRFEDLIVTLAAGERKTLNFGVGGLALPVRAGVEGRVVRDLNNNGIVDANETGQANVLVYIDFNNNSTRDADEPQAATSAAGQYRLESGRAGSYAVRLNLAGSDWMQTLPAGNGGRWTNFVNAQAVAAEPFAVRPRVIPPTFATVSGTVYNDANRNGRKDAGEVGRANVVVYLDLNYNNALDATEPRRTTASNGAYTFGEVAPGNVAVRIVRPPSFMQTQPASNGGHWLTAVAGTTYGERHFGLYETPLGSRVSGLVYLDANTNGRRDDGEAVVSNIRVYLDANFNNRRDDGEPSTLTTSAGTYVFEAVKTGTVAVRVALSNDYRQTAPSANGSHWLTSTNGGNFAGRNFGITRVASPAAANTLTGSVFGDWNANGTRQSGENGVSGIKVYLDYNLNGKYDAGEPLSVTNSSGVYKFDAVRAGTLAVRMNLTNIGWVQTAPTGNSAIWINFTPGMNAKDKHFMIRPK